jgi:hypothetical protein
MSAGTSENACGHTRKSQISFEIKAWYLIQLLLTLRKNPDIWKRSRSRRFTEPVESGERYAL